MIPIFLAREMIRLSHVKVCFFNFLRLKLQNVNKFGKAIAASALLELHVFLHAAFFEFFDRTYNLMIL